MKLEVCKVNFWRECQKEHFIAKAVASSFILTWKFLLSNLPFYIPYEHKSVFWLFSFKFSSYFSSIISPTMCPKAIDRWRSVWQLETGDCFIGNRVINRMCCIKKIPLPRKDGCYDKITYLAVSEHPGFLCFEWFMVL